MKRNSSFDDDRPARRSSASKPEDEEDRYSWLEFDKDDEKEEEGYDEDLEEEEIESDFLDDEDAFEEEPEDDGLDFGGLRDDDEE